MLTNITMLHWLWILPLLIIFYCVIAHKRRGRLQRSGGPNTRGAIASVSSPTASVFRVIFILAALAALIIALAGPAWNPIEETIQREGRDVVFVLDVSKSMLAEDLRPNRLERAKIDIADCLESLDGDRVALVVFAGTASVQCPLTQDYGFFRMMLADVSPDSVSRGGTAIGDALRVAQKQVFDEQDKAYRDIILITDGEDHDSFPVEAAKEIGAANIRLIAIGIGDDTDGTPIPITDPQTGLKRNLTYKGEIVRSKLDSATLKQMAEATPQGIYLPVATNTMDLRAIYSQLIAHAARRAMATEQVTRLQPKFQIFIGITMILLALAMILPRGRRTLPQSLVILVMLCCANSWGAPSAQSLLQAGNDAAASGDNATAVEKYREAEAIASPEKLPYIQYNRALAQMTDAPEEAEKALNDAIASAKQAPKTDTAFQANCLTATGNLKYHQAEKLAGAPQSLNEAKDAIEQSIKCYNDAVALNPATATTASENLKNARLKRQQILQQLRLQPPQQNQQKQKNEQQQDNKQEQQQQQQDNQQQQQNQEQQQEQQKQDKQQEQQSQERQENEQQEQQSQEQQQQNEQQEQQSQDQQQDKQQQEQQQTQQKQDEQQQQAQAAATKESEDKEKQPEAKPLDRNLQQIIDAEKLHRMQQRAKQSRQSPVDKDW